MRIAAVMSDQSQSYYKSNLDCSSVALLILLSFSFFLFIRFYGLWMWFPSLFDEVETTGAVCTANRSDVPDKSNNTIIYTDGFYTALSNLPGNLVSIFLMDVLGRKALLCK